MDWPVCKLQACNLVLIWFAQAEWQKVFRYLMLLIWDEPDVCDDTTLFSQIEVSIDLYIYHYMSVLFKVLCQLSNKQAQKVD